MGAPPFRVGSWTPAMPGDALLCPNKLSSECNDCTPVKSIGGKRGGVLGRLWIADCGFEIAQERVRQSRRWQLKLHSCFTQITGLHQTSINLKPGTRPKGGSPKDKSKIWNSKVVGAADSWIIRARLPTRHQSGTWIWSGENSKCHWSQLEWADWRHIEPLELTYIDGFYFLFFSAAFT